MKQNNTHHLVCLRLLRGEGLPQVLVPAIAAVTLHARERPAHVAAAAAQPLRHHHHHRQNYQLSSHTKAQHQCSNKLLIN